MNYNQSEISVGTSKAEPLVSEALQSLWEKVRAASELLTQLRADQRTLSDRLGRKEQELAAVQSELSNMEQELKRLRAENLQLISSNGDNVFSNEEKEILKSRIRELIAKINSHL